MRRDYFKLLNTKRRTADINLFDMITPCLAYDSSRHLYRFNVGANATQAEVQKLTGTSVLQWQNVASIATPVAGNCYFDVNSFTFGIVTGMTNNDSGEGQ